MHITQAYITLLLVQFYTYISIIFQLLYQMHEKALINHALPDLSVLFLLII